MDNFQGVLEFVRVIEEGSFSKAAQALGRSKAYVSQSVSQLENRLDTRLIHRTTRKLSLTEAGQLFFHYASQATKRLDEGIERTRDLQENIRGKIKISIVDGGLGEWYFAPAVARFVGQNPGISLEMDLSSRFVDLVEEGYDFAIRVGALQDSSLIARHLTSFRYGLYAAPSYLEKHGIITFPEELKEHNCLTGASTKWPLSHGEESFVLTPKGSWHSKSGQALIAAAGEGIGIVRTASFYAKKALNQGTVVEILPEWTKDHTKIWIVYPSNRNTPRRVSCAMNFLFDAFHGTAL